MQVTREPTDHTVPSSEDAQENSGDLSAEGGSRVIGGWSGRDSDDENRLVEAARTDREAFGILYDRYFDVIYHYIARRVGNDRVAEDLAGAVWERALTAIERYEVRGVPFAAWLYRIAGNLVANHHRKRKLRSTVPFTRQRTSRDPRDRVDDRAMVRNALRQLSEADQEVLGLCYYAGMTPPEIAEVLDCTPAAVHKRLHRARARLRDRIEVDSSV